MGSTTVLRAGVLTGYLSRSSCQPPWEWEGVGREGGIPPRMRNVVPLGAEGYVHVCISVCHEDPVNPRQQPHAS